ncbi:MAG: Secretion system C-terminal sorting domain, partial [Bacteroidota bacterium]
NGNLNNQWNIAITNGGNYTYTITDANDCQYSGNVLITSIVEEYPSTDLVIFPNPIAQENRIEIRSQSIMKMIEIFDSNGALISIIHATGKQQSFATTDWSSGIYNVRVTTNEGSILRRIVKL